MVTPKIITPPTVEPIVWSDVLKHSRALAADQAYCEGLIKAVRQHLEKRTGRAFIEQTLELTLDCFPGVWGVIELPRAIPLQSVVSVKYKDSSGVETTVLDADYVVDTDSYPGRIAPVYGKSWPTFTPYPLSPIHVRYIAGHRGADLSPAVPFPDEDIKHAMKLLVGHFYEHREAVIVGDNGTIESKAMALAMDDLLAQFEIPVF